MPEDINELPSLDSFDPVTRKHLVESFLLVANIHSWKKPINALVKCSEQELNSITHAIYVITGSKEIEVTQEDSCYRIVAEGFYNAVGQGRGII